VTCPPKDLIQQIFFPLNVGNKWYTIWFEVVPMFFAGNRQITSTETVNDTLYYLPGYYRKDSLGNVYQRIDSVDQLLYKVAGNVGDSWRVRAGDTYLVTLQSHSDYVTTFAGSFSRCKRLFFKDLDHVTDFDYAVWLAPGIGEVVWNGGMFLGYRGLKRAELNSVVISAPFHVVPLAPLQNQPNVDTSSDISFYLDSVVDTNLVVRRVTVFSKKGGEIRGVAHNYGNSFQTYTFSPSNEFLPSDTIIVRISADIIDVFGEGLDGNGNGRYEGSPTDDYTWTFFTQTVTKVHDAESTVPDDFVLHQNYPNPFNPETFIKYELRTTARVKLIVFDIEGRCVKKLVDDVFPPGVYEVRWDGRNTDGKKTASGTYIYQIIANDHQLSKKLQLLK